jgi:hypothetical protein
MKDLKIKKWLVALFSLVFLYPMVELVTPIRISVLLNKSSLTSSIVDFTGDSWFSGSYQESFSDYVNDNMGC